MAEKGRTTTILVADDDADTRELLTYIVLADGYDVVTAADGRDALDKVIALRPDLVLLDVMMPEIHGYAVCHAIKTDNALKDTKVVILSAKNFIADHYQAGQVGADAFLAKPVQPAKILDQIKALLSPLEPLHA